MSIRARDMYKASFETLYQLLTDEAFLRQKYEAVGSRRLEFQECRQGDNAFRIRWTREMPANPPELLKSFISPWNKLSESMDWRAVDEGIEGSYKAKIKDLNVTLSGRFLLSREGSGCVETIEMKAEVRILFVGDKIAKLVESDTQQNLQAEYDFTRRYLGEL